MAKHRNTWRRRIVSLGILGLLRLPLILPYRARGPVVAWLMGRIVAPLAGYDRRVRANLAHVLPNLPEAEIRRLCRAVPANTGRTLIEMGSGAAFTRRIDPSALRGPGVAALDAAHQAGRPIIVVSGHFGNWDAVRYALAARGHQVGAIYRPLDDPMLDAAFRDMLEKIAQPLFPRGRRGLAQMIRFLRKGNTVAILIDQYVNRAAPLTFFGKTAPTSLSAAEMALKYDALLVPAYGLRTAAGFDLIAEAPVAHTTATAMTQALNDSLEAQVRAHMDQWLWIHRRWKPERQTRQRKRAAARTSP
ncbi:MAG: lysophospholipid acyltransferase family protein [Qingshengfaniella sp.]